MTDSGWLRHGVAIGRLEFRRTVRSLWQDKARVAMLALGVVIPAVLVSLLAVLFADSIRGIEALPEPAHIRGTITLFWLFAVFLVGQRVVSLRTRIEAESFVLTSVSARAVAGGLLVAETLRLLAYLAAPIVVATGICVFLLGSPASLVVVPAAALLFTATAVVAGSACGYAVAWLVATSPFVARHRTVLGTVAAVVGMGGYFVFLYPQIGGVDQSSLAWVPIGWLVDLALVGTGLIAPSLRWVGVLLATVVLLVGGGAVVERLTTALWFIEPVSVDSGSSTRGSDADGANAKSTTDRRDALSSAVAPLALPRGLSTPTRRVAEWVLLRTRRDPNRLTFLMIPLFAIGSAVANMAIQSGSVDTMAAPLIAVALPWTVGSLFAMNPFGDEGAVLPVTLTAVSGAQYVRGLLVPGLLLGLPTVAVVTGIATIISPYTLAERLALVVLALYLTCVAAAITPAIGMALPRFSGISAGQSREVIPPRMSAVAVHGLLTVVPGALLVGLVLAPEATQVALAGVFGFLPAFLLELLASVTTGALTIPAAWFGALGAGLLEVELMHLQIAVGGAIALGGLVVARLLYRHAISRFERYTLS